MLYYKNYMYELKTHACDSRLQKANDFKHLKEWYESRYQHIEFNFPHSRKPIIKQEGEQT